MNIVREWITLETLGQRIRHYRKLKGLTQKQLAELIGVKHNSVSDWERDENRPYADTFELLLSALEVDANTLLGWETSEQIKKEAEVLAEQIINNPKIKKALPIISNLNDEDMDLVLSFIQRISKEGM